MGQFFAGFPKVGKCTPNLAFQYPRGKQFSLNDMVTKRVLAFLPMLFSNNSDGLCTFQWSPASQIGIDGQPEKIIPTTFSFHFYFNFNEPFGWTRFKVNRILLAVAIHWAWGNQSTRSVRFFHQKHPLCRRERGKWMPHWKWFDYIVIP